MATTLNGGAWSHAVPVEETDGNARHFSYRRDTIGNGDGDVQKLEKLEKRPSAWDLMSDSETTKQRRTSLRQSYSTAGRKRSRNALREKRQQEQDENVPNVDDSAWIHRDKLAQIEIQEMAEAGIHVRRSRRSESAGPNETRNARSVSRSSVHRPRSRTSQSRQNDINNDADYANAYPAPDDHPHKRISTVAAPTELEPQQQADADFDPYRDSEFRSADEVASARQTNRQQIARPSTSRIPVSRISPVPVPQNVVDRDSPLPRSRAGSQNWSGSFDEMQYQRKLRSPSVSSAVLLDSDPERTRTTPPGSSSNKHSSNDETTPPRARVPNKATPGSRKTSGAAPAARPGSSHANKRIASASAQDRPGSSSGHKTRPSTGRQSPPEGEAPWIATMYKPDPRLPPDQQMLPTHAKKMMQQQWEKEGKTGTVYDREFNLLNDEEPQKPRLPMLTIDSQQSLHPRPQRSPSPQKHGPSPSGSAQGPWPLSPTKSDTRSDSGSVRPGTSGGYKITPTIPSTPTIQRSHATSPAAPQTNAVHDHTPRMPDVDEKQEEAAAKKGCCCVVM